MNASDLLSRFHGIFDRMADLQVRAPGRVNLLGEHVDYNQGAVLPAAIDRYVYLAAAPLDERLVQLEALDLDERAVFSLADLGSKTDIAGKPLPGWAHYPAGVAWALQAAGYPLCGILAAYTSDIPIGAGLSSSAAVEVAFAAAWRSLGNWEIGCLELAQHCQRAENQYVGVNCGLMDQFASACAVADHAMHFDTRSLIWEALPLPPGVAIVIADTSVQRELSSSKYNQLRAACERAVDLLQAYKPELTSLRDISAVEFAAYSMFLPPEIARRAEHVVKEIQRVEQAVGALQRGDARMFGGLMFAGHQSLRDLYRVSTPELDALVEIARGLPGIYGARLTGAGFGGCTVNLVAADQASTFVEMLGERYRQQTGRQAQVVLCRASSGAEVEEVYMDY
jgi:galactokinase